MSQYIVVSLLAMVAVTILMVMFLKFEYGKMFASDIKWLLFWWAASWVPVLGTMILGLSVLGFCMLGVFKLYDEWNATGIWHRFTCWAATLINRKVFRLKNGWENVE